jgi:hypothetical protein
VVRAVSGLQARIAELETENAALRAATPDAKSATFYTGM